MLALYNAFPKNLYPFYLLETDGLATVQVSNLPENTFEEFLKPIIEKVVPVEVLHVEVNYFTRTILNSAIFAVKQKHLRTILQTKTLFLGKFCLDFKKFSLDTTEIYAMKHFKEAYRPPVADWPHDVRPGHPDYQLQELSDEPFDMDPPDQDRPSAHSLIDDVLLIIFKELKVCELLRIEGTCRRWQWMVRRILGGHKFVNLADKTSIWGDFESTQKSRDKSFTPYLGSSFIHKILILNSDTLEHLIIYNLCTDHDNVRLAIKQCCPNLSHCFDVTRKFSTKRFYYWASFVDIRPLTLPMTYSEFSRYSGGIHYYNKYNFSPTCTCTDYIDQVLDQAAATANFLALEEIV